MRARKIFAIGVATAAGLAAAMAEATSQRSFVASTGQDTNLCTIAAPCRSFTRALAETNAGGEVIVQDSAGYGAFTIDRSVAIVAPPGVYGGITAFAPFSGITVDAPGVRVVLSGLTVNGQGGVNGIWLKQGAELTVERCAASGLVSGIVAEAGTATIRDTTVHGNSQDGIRIDYGVVAAHMDGVRAHGNATGIRVQALNSSVRASIRNAAITENTYAGILVDALVNALAVVDIESAEVTGNGFAAAGYAISVVSSDSTGKAEVSVARTLIARNQAGISANQLVGVVHLSVTDSTITGNYGQGINSHGATVIASNNTVTRNAFEGMKTDASGTFLSRVNNNVQSNFGGDTAGTIQTLTPK